MSIQEYLLSRPGTVVIIDDDLAAPNLEGLSPAEQTRFYNMLSANADAREALCEQLGLPSDTSAEDLAMEAVNSAASLWSAYRANNNGGGSLRPCLEVLFESVSLQERQKRSKLETLIAFCKTELGVTPLEYSSYAQASSHVRESLVVFVDFHLRPGAPQEEAIGIHSQHRDLYQEPFRYGTLELPKLVFLISWNALGRDELQSFRSGIDLRSAFFSAVRKSDISVEFMARKFAYYQQSYETLRQLNSYLVFAEDAVNRCAAALTSQVKRIELHDLTMLSAFKLDAENESLQSYLTWILSEALAAKFRGSPELRSELLPFTSHVLPDAKLLPESVLFQLFSEIASLPSMPSPDARLAFGQVYRGSETRGAENRLLLVISPACDLIRCRDEDDVLCVRGSITGTHKQTASLFEKKRKLFGKGDAGKDEKIVRHIMKFGSDDAIYDIEWNIGTICTVQAADLIDKRKYVLVAQTSELFCQEVKEAAVAHVSRVGVPVDPSFVVAARVVVRYQFKQGQSDPLVGEKEPSDDLVSGLVSFGNKTRDTSRYMVVVFTREFVEWLHAVLLPVLEKEATSYPKLRGVVEHLKEWDFPPLHFKDFGDKKGINDLSIRLDRSTDFDALANNKMEIRVIVEQ